MKLKVSFCGYFGWVKSVYRRNIIVLGSVIANAVYVGKESPRWFRMGALLEPLRPPWAL